jgi:acetylornithine/succinyldiaminopimelate/putrescine aminotransferase
MLGFEMVLPMNTGAEAVETAVKIARKWGYKVKGIPENKAWVFSAQENFHGRTVSTSKRHNFTLIRGLTHIAVRCHHHVHRP